MRLIDHLIALRDVWMGQTGASAASLAKQVANDGKFFTLLDRPGATITIRTFEKFLAFFRDGANWPNNVIPLAAADMLDRLDNIATEQAATTGQNDDLSRDRDEAA